MQERTTAAWEQLRISQIFPVIAFHALFDDFCEITQAAQFRLLFVIAISPIHTILYVAQAIQILADERSDATLWHHFCNGAR